MVLCPLIIPQGVKTSGHMNSGQKLPKTSLDPKSAVDSISELYFDPRTRLDAVSSSCSRTSRNKKPTPVLSLPDATRLGELAYGYQLTTSHARPPRRAHAHPAGLSLGPGFKITYRSLGLFVAAVCDQLHIASLHLCMPTVIRRKRAQH